MDPPGSGLRTMRGYPRTTRLAADCALLRASSLRISAVSPEAVAVHPRLSVGRLGACAKFCRSASHLRNPPPEHGPPLALGTFRLHSE